MTVGTCRGSRAEPVDDSVPLETEWLPKNDGIVLIGQTNDASLGVTRKQIRSTAKGRHPAALWYYSGTCGGRSVEETAKATTPCYSDYSDRAEALWHLVPAPSSTPRRAPGAPTPSTDCPRHHPPLRIAANR